MPAPPDAELARLRRSVDELALLNEVAVALGSARELDVAVHTLVRRSIEAMGAEQGVVTLIDRQSTGAAETYVRTVRGIREALRPDEALLGWAAHHRRTLRLDDLREEPFAQFDWGDGVRTVLCAPLIAHGEFLGVLTLYNKTAGPFTAGDARLLTILAMQSAQTLDASRREAERTRILDLFGRHTAPSVVDELIRHEADPPGRRVAACVMFLDVRDFTTFAEQAEPEAVVAFLNRFFGMTVDAVTSRGGIVHQLLGDGFMAIFGAPIQSPADCTHAVEASLDIVARIAAEVEAGHLRPTTVGIGLHTGDVVAGTVGSIQHKEYKVTGDVVNVAARVEGLNKALGSQVLATRAVWERLPRGQFEGEALGAVRLRGRAAAQELYRLA
ncbi:adenylate/guanylate cyclase domain-containing protein [Rubrivirga sp. IMCC43871]|uniref:adenylate/guanylate cyclase domain-containing protein n=1 Tax=Rubrivirga sp. IMCC43871 TaxID=3391575 RepID=UPI00398FAF42